MYLFYSLCTLGKCWHFVCIGGWEPKPRPPSWSQSWIDYIRNIRPLFPDTVFTTSDSMCVPARTETLLYQKLRNENILTRRAGISLVVTFHTSPPGWRRHLGEVFSDHLGHGTLFLLGSVCAFSVTTCAIDHPECFVRSSALSPRLVFRVSSMYELRRRAAASLQFYRLGWSARVWAGPVGFIEKVPAAHATRARVTPLTCNSAKTHTLCFITTNTRL